MPEARATRCPWTVRVGTEKGGGSVLLLLPGSVLFVYESRWSERELGARVTRSTIWVQACVCAVY